MAVFQCVKCSSCSDVNWRTVVLQEIPKKSEWVVMWYSQMLGIKVLSMMKSNRSPGSCRIYPQILYGIENKIFNLLITSVNSVLHRGMKCRCSLLRITLLLMYWSTEKRRASSSAPPLPVFCYGFVDVGPCLFYSRSSVTDDNHFHRYQCVECGISNALLPSLQRHYTKMHHAPFTSECYLQLPVEEEKEAWVSKL